MYQKPEGLVTCYKARGVSVTNKQQQPGHFNSNGHSYTQRRCLGGRMGASGVDCIQIYVICILRIMLKGTASCLLL